MRALRESSAEALLADQLVEALRRRPRKPLAEPSWDTESSPGVYALFLASNHPLLGQAGTATSCWYIGSAASRRQRLRRHRTSFAEADGLSVDEVWCSTLETASLGSALFIEYLMTRALRPLGNCEVKGLGSMRPGSTRQGRPSRFDSLFCRSWVTPPSAVETAAAASALVAALAEPGRLKQLWAPLRA